jgi:hypothetical protein
MEIIFDRQGLIEYPGLEEKLLKPLTEKGKTLGMWTLEGRGWAQDDIDKLGLGNYFSFLVGKQDIRGIKQSVEKSDQDLLDEVRTRIGIQTSLTLEQTANLWKKWMNYAKTDETRCKYPPILGLPNAVVIDSDHGNTYRGFSDRFEVDYYLNFAWTAGSSLILVPEYPDVWKDIENPKVSPEEIVNQLMRKLDNWDGGQLVSDIGRESGIYEIS